MSIKAVDLTKAPPKSIGDADLFKKISAEKQMCKKFYVSAAVHTNVIIIHYL